MRKAFTIIELLIVVVVITILLAITFRLTQIGGENAARNETLLKMERIENALSGYFAAFGSYPPVELYASRNVYTAVDQNGRQKEGQEDSNLKWDNVKVACEAQPIGARFPFTDEDADKRTVETALEEVRFRISHNIGEWKKYPQLASGFIMAREPNDFPGWDTEASWQSGPHIFQFGVMSFLLPRYLFMSNGVEARNLNKCAQWTASNKYSSHPNTGIQFGDWKDQLRDRRLVMRIPSQAVCARWMPNFKGIVTMNPKKIGEKEDASTTLFGVNVMDSNGISAFTVSDDIGPEVFLRNVDLRDRKALDTMTIRDGWYNDFYYYSPPPFQSYRLWSAGPNGKTFPPWVPLKTLKTDADRQQAAAWAKDDIMFMSN